MKMMAEIHENLQSCEPGKTRESDGSGEPPSLALLLRLFLAWEPRYTWSLSDLGNRERKSG